jgi:acyl transferase domain-containing protein
VFRDEIDRCAALLGPLTDLDLRAVLYPATPSAEAQQRLMSTVAAQPAIFSVEYALAKLWMSWGIIPQAMIGHSVGEFVAAVIAGVFSLQDALTVVAARGRLMQQLPGGAMLAVRLAEKEVVALLPESLALAAINGPELCVVSGPFDAIDGFEKLLGTRQVVTRRLHTSHAFHSAMVDPVIAPLRELIQTLSLSAPNIPYVSCVTGTWIRAEEATSPDYWARHARNPVRFADGIAAAAAEGAGTSIMLEVGPGATLSALAAQSKRARQIAVISSMQDAARARDDRECLLESLGRLWVRGVRPLWPAVHASPRSRVALPTYPFERVRHWIDAPVPAAGDARPQPHPRRAARPES